jgi:fructose-1-phosphate kinase PfkB-like protein
MSQKKLMVIGLNPALQKLLNFSKFQPGTVNRAEMISYISGGKAANFAKAAKNIGTDTVIYQFSGGASGDKYRKILNLEKLQFVNELTQAETRICSTIMSRKSSEVTEIIEPSDMISENEAKKLLARTISDLQQFDGIALCGTYPPGIKPKFYAKIAAQAAKANIPLLMDACTNIEAVLNEYVEILKINLDELKLLSGKRKAETAANYIFVKYNVKIIAVTDGPKSAHLFLRKSGENPKRGCTHYEYSIPKLKNVINPIGAGDTVSAVLLAQYIAGQPIHEAFKIALASGSASCLTTQNAVFDANFAKKLASREIKLHEK